MNTTKNKNTSCSEKKSSEVAKIDQGEISPDDSDDEPETEENRAFMISSSMATIKNYYKNYHKFRDPNYMFDLKAKGLTTPEEFVTWWNEKHPDCQITVESIKKWTYRDDQDPTFISMHWDMYE
ncbi:kinase-like domain-containing protein [Gigaspora margarita]|uniref:Kinase-like domain-containing protein n=1 Tax=Gigaspora margarita TaxID=4874 RepID=A0A8H4A6J7_GIGMA|nr:kinase-like domain-containing protein [Gigaspora margarita]